MLLEGTYTITENGSFYVIVVYSGSGLIICNDKEYSYAQGDEIFISAAISEVTVNANESSKILLCYPPN